MISRQPLQPLKVSDCYTKFTRQEYFKVTPLTRLVDLNLGFQKSDFLFVTIDGFPLAVVTREDVEKFWRRVKGRS